MTPRWHDADAASQYVAGTLDPDTLDAFEEHLLSCEECRREVRGGAAVRTALVASPARITARRRRALGVAAVASAAAVLTLVVNAEARRRNLAAVDAPPFVAAAARSPGSVATTVDSGMRAYAAGDFGGAARLLGAAAERDSTPGLAFFLGVALLKEGEARAALAALERARTPEGNPFADDATLFAAKALVRLRNPDSAVSLLERAAASAATPALLRAFSDSIRGR